MADYKVGYKNPPEHGKIRKGECRNPNGRRGNKPTPVPPDNSLAAIIEKLDNELVEFKGETITKWEAGIRVLQAKALGGDIRAMQQFEKLREKAGAHNSNKGSGVLLLPSAVSLEEWEAAAAIQQAQFREADYGR